MKKTFLSILIGLMMFGASGSTWAAPPATDLQCNPLGCVDDTDIAASAVTNAKIADGAVTDAKITGPIASSKLEKPANVVVVAKSGGDYTSIQAAINAVNPTAENPVLIKVMPGTYPEAVTMKSYINLQGAGREFATIFVPSTADAGISCSNVNNIIISGFKIVGFKSYLRYSLYNIYIENSSYVYIKDNDISGAYDDSNNIGIFIWSTSSNITVDNNIVTNTGYIGIRAEGQDSRTTNNIIKDNYQWALSSLNGFVQGNTISNCNFCVKAYNSVITGNVIKNGTTGGIHVTNGSSPVISGNTITQNNIGIEIYGSPVITNNVITGNQADISVQNGAPTINLNTINAYTNSGAGTPKGRYNVDLEGNDLIIQ